MHLACTRNLNMPPMLLCAAATRPAVAIWTRPTPDRDADFVKPSYLPTPGTTPLYQPGRREEGTPLYAPQPSEFRPAELPDRAKELPAGPKMPERRPDPIPAGTHAHAEQAGPWHRAGQQHGHSSVLCIECMPQVWWDNTVCCMHLCKREGSRVTLLIIIVAQRYCTHGHGT